MTTPKVYGYPAIHCGVAWTGLWETGMIDVEVGMVTRSEGFRGVGLDDCEFQRATYHEKTG